MKRSWRKRLLLLILLLVIPVAIGGTVLVLAWTRNLGQVLANQWVLIGMPGQLKVGEVAIRSSHEIEIIGLEISEPGTGPGRKPLATARRIVVEYELLTRKFRGAKAEGLHLYLDAANYRLLDGIIEANGRIPSSKPPLQWRLTVVDGSAAMANGLAAAGVSLDGMVVGPEFQLHAEGHLVGDDRPMLVDIGSKAVTAGSDNRRLTVAVKQGRAPDLLTAWDAVVGMDLLPPLPTGLIPWLPTGQIELSGTVVTRDLGRFWWESEFHLGWAGGGVDGRLTADRRLVAADLTRFRDDRMIGAIEAPVDGRPRARIEGDLDRKSVVIRSDGFIPGARLPIPKGLPVEALRRLLPIGTLEWRLGADPGAGLTLSAAGSGKARLALAWSDSGPLRVKASELPLALTQELIPGFPAGLRLDGFLTDLAVVMDAGGGLPSDLEAEVRAATVSGGEWSFGPVEARLAMHPAQPAGQARLADQDRSVAVELPFGTFRASGSLTRVRGTVELKAVEDLLARVRGPSTLPDLRGGIRAELDAERAADGSVAVTAEHLDLERLEWRDQVRQISAQMRGRGRLVPEPTGWHLTGEAGGQLRDGDLRLGRNWLDLAAQTPIFTAKVDLAPAPTGMALSLSELLVRAADPSGTPLPTGYSAGFRLDLQPTGAGRINGLVDHVDLAWLNRQVPGLAPNSLAGDSALTGSGLISDGRLQRLEGNFLPLSTDLVLGTRFKVRGITGAVRFAVDLPPE